MPISDTSASPRAPRSRAPRPKPGPPVEVWLWKVIPKTGRGEHRTLTDNVQYVDWEYVWSRRTPTKGRYRIEFRDDRSAIVSVRYAMFDPRSGEGPYYTTGRARRSQRKVPPPRPAWEPRPEPAAPASRTTPAQANTSTRAPSPAPTALRPPVAALPPGMMWRQRKNGNWEHFDRSQAVPADYHPVWLADSKQVVLVYSPTGTWPGHEWSKLTNGTSVLVPVKRPRS